LQPNTITRYSEVSLYKKGIVDPDTFALGLKLLAGAFPRLQTNWFNTLKFMIKDEGFNNERFMDAVKNIIREFDCLKYGDPKIADIISYDRKRKYFSQGELLEISKYFSNEQRGEMFKEYVYDSKINKYYKKED